MPTTENHTTLTPETVAVPPLNYKEELAIQAALTEKAKEHYRAAKEETDKIRKQATKQEVELQQPLDARIAKHQRLKVLHKSRVETTLGHNRVPDTTSNKKQRQKNGKNEDTQR